MSLDAFLNPIETEQVFEFTVSDRFKNKDGSIATIKMKTLTQAENDAIIKRCQIKETGKNGVVSTRLDTMKYQDMLILECIVEPNFTSEEFCKKMGVVDPALALKKLFTPAEYIEIINHVNDCMGNILQAGDEAKN